MRNMLELSTSVGSTGYGHSRDLCSEVDGTAEGPNDTAEASKSDRVGH